MRKTILLFLICSFTAFFASGQKAKVQTAYNFYKEPYRQFDKAKEAIDEAILNEQSAGMAKTWYYRGLIYQALYKNEKYGSLCNECLKTAYEAFERAILIEPDNDWVVEIREVHMRNLANSVFVIASDAFKAKDFKVALSNFELMQKMVPADTAVILYSAYAAEGGGNFSKAKEYYKKVMDLKYSDDNMYQNLSNIYLNEDKDTANALSIIRQGRTIFPDSMGLLVAEINLLLSTGQNEEATRQLNTATQKDPNNEKLYYVLGSTFDNLANPKDKNGKELPKSKNYDEYIAKAIEAYTKGLSINADNYLINYNLGALYYNQAAAIKNEANKLQSTEQYNKEKVKFDKKFREAQPYFENALYKNPKITKEDKDTYFDTANLLKQLYAQTGDTEKYEKIKALIENK